MRRVRALWERRVFQDNLILIERAEERREFCRHGLAHLLDVARIAWILNLERGRGLDRELVYAAALLHDIGRSAQYATGEPHDEAGERIAAELLDALPEGSRFSAGERAMILAAVRAHRGEGAPDASTCDQGLAALIHEADNRSRACYACPARAECYWPDERKNLSIEI